MDLPLIDEFDLALANDAVEVLLDEVLDRVLDDALESLPGLGDGPLDLDLLLTEGSDLLT